MSNLSPYLFFDGNCADAMRFYERTLGGKLDLMKASDSPVAAEMPPGSGDQILHVRSSAYSVSVERRSGVPRPA